MSLEPSPSGSSANLLSAYELQRLENIKSLQNELGGAFLEVQQSVNNLAGSVERNRETSSENNSQRWKRTAGGKRPLKSVEIIRRSARIRHVKTNTPISYNEQSDSDDNSDENNKKKKFRKGSLLIKFPWTVNNQNKERDRQFYNALNDSDFLTDDEEELDDLEFNSRRQNRHRSAAPANQLPASQITAEMIENVHYSSSGKKYSACGTTCHQCRQKTLDQKSYCRHKGCRGIRGMFCGFCLGKRYGENVAEVLLEKKWACPPCRGYCNCSICRRRQGKSPTGQLASVALANGYKSVRHLLVQTEGENSKTLTSDEDEEKENVSEVKSDESKENNMNETKNKQEGIFEGNIGGKVQFSHVSNKKMKTEETSSDENINKKNKVSSAKLESNYSDSSEDQEMYCLNLDSRFDGKSVVDDDLFKQRVLPLLI